MSDACPKCQSTKLSLLKRPTSLGYQRLDARDVGVPSTSVAIQSLTFLSIQQISF